MAAYFRYAKTLKAGPYILTLALFAFGLMSKPMLVTLPFVLLLLDYWPLERFNGNNLRHLILEKIPFFILAAVSSVVTFFVQRSAGAVREIESIPLTARTANAVIAYVKYIEKLFVPARLAPFYPFPDEMPPLWQVFAAIILLLIITALVIRFGSKYKYLPVGWLWYIGTLVPVIGMVQVGDQAVADRYTYIPLTGLFIAIAWGTNDLLAGWKHRKIFLCFSSLVIISILSVLTWFQTAYWRNSEALFERALKVTNRNYLAHNNLGLVRMGQNKINEAVDHFRQSLLIKPDYVPAMNNLGFIYNRIGLTQEAIAASKQAVKINPEYAGAYCNLARAYNDSNQPRDAMEACEKAISLNPDFAEAYCNLGVAYGRLNKPLEAVENFKRAIKLKPDFTEACYNLGVIWMQLGRSKDAAEAFRQAIRFNPDFTVAHYGLGIAYLTAGNKDAATAEYEILRKLDPEKANQLLTSIKK